MSKVNSTSQNAINAEKVNFDSLKNDRLKSLRFALSSARRVGKIKNQMPDEAAYARIHLSAAETLYVRAEDAFSSGDESLGNVFITVAGIEVFRAAIAAADAMECEEVKPNELPSGFIELCEDFEASPETLFGDAEEPSVLRSRLYDEYFLDIETLFDRTGRLRAVLFQASSGIVFERAFDRGTIAYSGGKIVPLYGIAAGVFEELAEELGDYVSL